MPYFRFTTFWRVLTLLAGLLVLKVTGSVVLNYVNYLPPNFESDFLHGRQSYFWGSYRWAFYTHIAAGPVSLILGMILISERFRQRFPVWHRKLGRTQGMVVLLLVAPSGLWMAYRAEAGPVAGVGFAALAIMTALTVAMGWRAAVGRHFGEHRRWMSRCFLLLCSTVVLRLMAGLATVTGFDHAWFDPSIAWASWLVPLAAFESSGVLSRSFRASATGNRRPLEHRRATLAEHPADEVRPSTLDDARRITHVARVPP
jgi:hypothetical protein